MKPFLSRTVTSLIYERRTRKMIEARELANVFLYFTFIIPHMGCRISIFLLSLSVFVTLVLIMAVGSSLAKTSRVRDITAGNSTVWYGGEKIGNLTVAFKINDYLPVSGGLVNITAHVFRQLKEIFLKGDLLIPMSQPIIT